MRNTEVTPSTAAASGNGAAQAPNSYSTNFFDQFDALNGGGSTVSRGGTARSSDGRSSSTTVNGASGSGTDVTPLEPAEARILDRVAETLARLGRVRRVGLGPREKREFVALWRKRGRG